MATWRPITLTLTDDLGPLPPHASPARPRHGLRRLERLLLLIGIVCLGYYGYVTSETALYQAYETRELDAILASAPATRETPREYSDALVLPRANAPVIPRKRPAAGSALGRLEIPRLSVSAIVRVGSDSRTLRLAIGHIGGTALPGERGNMGLAAHRDTFFRRLGEIRPDDQVRLVTPDGTFVYRVEQTQVVEPRDTWVLNPTDEPALTLVTCYPFRYVGSAPQRFIVRARLTER
jgi:sortase A